MRHKDLVWNRQNIGVADFISLRQIQQGGMIPHFSPIHRKSFGEQR